MPSSSQSPSTRGTLPHYPSETTVVEEEHEDSPLLPTASPSSQPPEDPTAIYVKLLEAHLPWYKRPSALWLLPIFVVVTISGGMMSSSVGQYHASLLCRQFFNNYTPANATLAAIIAHAQETPDGLTQFLFDSVSMDMNGMVVPLLPVAECREPDIQAYTAKILAFLDVLSALAGTLSIGYYSSLSDRFGRLPFLILAPVNTLWILGGLAVMGYYWDQVGLYMMIVGMAVSGLLGGFGIGLTMALAYAADCTEPSKRNTIFSWIHAALFFGLTLGPILGGIIVIATKTIMTIIYMDAVVTIIALSVIIIVVPESLPSRQSPQIRSLYEHALQATGSSPSDNVKGKEKAEDGPWYSHALRSLKFFKPTGQNMNLLLLAGMSFMATLALRGSFTVLILYTNKVFHWTQKEDGTLSSLSSLVRVVTLLVVLPILGHFYRKHTEKKVQEDGGDSGKHTDQSQRQDVPRPQYHSGLESEGLAFDPNDSVIAASVEQLGEAALDLSGDEDEQGAKDHRRRQSAASTRSWGTDRTQIPASSPRSTASASTTQKPKQSGQASQKKSPSSPSTKDKDKPRSAAQVRADMRFDIWMIRVGFVISCTTYVGFGLATKGWMFYIWGALHAVAIIGTPSLKSLLTNLVNPSEFGAVLGALQVVDSISGIVSPVVISWVYAATVATRPEAVWYAIAAATGVCAVLAFMVRQKEFRKELV
ncbi:hypothetical protein BGZ81_010016 [Podila clonocystis]|nr:hypothetical protein BGZ81_010016 [Podila clonocystis]